MGILTQNILVKSIQRSFILLPNSFRKRSIVLFIGVLINSFLDIIGLAAILPLLAAILKEGFITTAPVVSEIYQTLGFTDERWFIVMLCVLIVVFISLKNVFGLWMQKVQIQYSQDVYENLSSNVLLSAYNKGYTFFNNENSNKLLNKIVGVPQRFAQVLLLQIFQFLNEFVVLVLIIISLFAYDFKILVLLFSVVAPTFYLFYQLSKKRVAYYSSRLNDLGPLISKPVYEIVFGFVDVVIGGVFESFRSKYLKNVNESKSLRTKSAVIQQIPNRLVEVCVIIAVVTMLLYGVFVLESPTEIVALLSVFALAAYRSIPSINRLMISLVNIKGQEFHLDLLEDFLPFQDLTTNNEEIPFNQSLELQNLSFKFSDSDSDSDLINQLNLIIKKGESIGIVGKSGSGKTTLMNILLGFLNQTSGSIQLDGIELTKNNMLSWQKKIGYVRQDVFLIDGTVAENIAFGIASDKVDTSKLNDVINKAQLREVINELSNGVQTNIGERGAKISGGQRQRVGIARALYHDAEILFFDEATSALDTNTEKEITEAVRSLHTENLTMIIIAHRESTLKYCDRIIKLS
jgi:ABC-type bacteriocin/lantibiotic exporter with double-glycine peptidase domain